MLTKNQIEERARVIKYFAASVASNGETWEIRHNAAYAIMYANESFTESRAIEFMMPHMREIFESRARDSLAWAERYLMNAMES